MSSTTGSRLTTHVIIMWQYHMPTPIPADPAYFLVLSSLTKFPHESESSIQLSLSTQTQVIVTQWATQQAGDSAYDYVVNESSTIYNS